VNESPKKKAVFAQIANRPVEQKVKESGGDKGGKKKGKPDGKIFRTRGGGKGRPLQLGRPTKMEGGGKKATRMHLEKQNKCGREGGTF